MTCPHNNTSLPFAVQLALAEHALVPGRMSVGKRIVSYERTIAILERCGFREAQTAEPAPKRQRRRGPSVKDIDRGKRGGAISVEKNGVTYTLGSSQVEQTTADNPFEREAARLRQLKRGGE